ncbi:hypothetical protein DL95DRAFT_310985 [Leptodontidium sp. 2 PMI_412]|nr:hypothetical protein BKA61DRAFT_574320 [Leptodontidium sp. MPI-SDFR-AT-0119]KAH9208907.1 hypothetical protein DL95DRAFT_310985 [Leptodontidium sp. 2 PMI_412]
MHALSLLLAPVLVSAAVVSSRHWRDDSRAAYFLDNNPAGSSVISLKIAEDGTLSYPVRISTGGKGLLALTAGMNGAPAAAGGADTLFTQDSVVVDGDYLFTVNAGSNTISMFSIDKADPSHPTLINTASTLGEFPSSVAYSSKLKTACVINGGAVAGVSCFSVDHSKGLKPQGGLRSIAIGQTTPPVGPPGTVSDIVFNPSETALFVSIKGAPPTPGSIYVYPVIDGYVSTTPVVSKPATLLVDFSLNFLGSDNKAVITDPAYGASLVDISSKFYVTVSKQIVVAGEKAICWAAYSDRFNSIVLLDGGSSNVTLVDPKSGDITGVAVLDTAGKGALDAKLDRTFMYILRGAPFVTVLSDMGLTHGKTPTELQSFDLSSLGNRAGFQGMAIYPAN